MCVAMPSEKVVRKPVKMVAESLSILTALKTHRERSVPPSQTRKVEQSVGRHEWMQSGKAMVE